MRGLIRRLVPPLFFDIYRTLLMRYGFFGNYSSWQEAKAESGGYDSDIILEKVKNALLQVKEGKAVYERDSVIFDKIIYPWPLLAGLLRIASKNGNKLNVVDYGGSIGTTYFQCREFLRDLDSLTWNIIEQKNFVDCGKKHFENETLKFYYDFESCFKETQPDLLLLSSVIQYLEKPYEFISRILRFDIKYILIDRTAILLQGKTRLTVQRVPPQVYSASYPAWFFNEAEFVSQFRAKYDLFVDFLSSDEANIPSVFKGFIFKLKNG